ncbi:MAG: ECF transporter S component [Clostridia bacterium]|nr:ECF transporter S component [Clostridia bacterium]
MNKTKKLTYSGIFIALGVVIPYIFHILGGPALGSVLLPMHIPVLLCGFICGKKHGFIVGLITPVLSYLVTGFTMPPMPIVIYMIFELSAYGFFAGLIYEKTGKKVLLALLGSMVIGRIVKGAVTFLMTVPFGNAFIFKGFMTSTFVVGIWGILIQLLLIPVVIKMYEKLTLNHQ